MNHRRIEPAIQYWGTPVVLISTVNADGTPNIAPMSSAWWLGWSCMLGLDASSRTVENLQARPDCVLNLASRATADAVNALARTTGTPHVPLHKRLLGYRHVADKARQANLHLTAGEVVDAPRVDECEVQLEARAVTVRPFGKHDPKSGVPLCAVEARIEAVHVAERLLGAPDKVDPNAWQPLLMCFRELFVQGERVGESRLARGPESNYATWKQRGVRRVAANLVSTLSRVQYGVPEEPSHEDG